MDFVTSWLSQAMCRAASQSKTSQTLTCCETPCLNPVMQIMLISTQYIMSFMSHPRNRERRRESAVKLSPQQDMLHIGEEWMENRKSLHDPDLRFEGQVFFGQLGS